MHNLTRRTLVLFIAWICAGCAAPKPYAPPIDAPLQDAPPGKAVLYFLRAPYDSAQVVVSTASERFAVLPSSTYTVVVMEPGTHVISAHEPAVIGEPKKISPDLQLELKANERRFFNLSGTTGRTPALSGLLPLAGGVIPLLLPSQETAPGSRSWKEVTELDAQGLIFISKLVFPEQGAL